MNCLNWHICCGIKCLNPLSSSRTSKAEPGALPGRSRRGVEEWLEVDLARQHIVTATETMGRYVGIRMFVLGIQYKITKLIFISNQTVDITGAKSAGLVVDAARSSRRPTASSTGAWGPGTPTRTWPATRWWRGTRTPGRPRSSSSFLPSSPLGSECYRGRGILAQWVTLTMAKLVTILMLMAVAPAWLESRKPW